MTEPFKFTRTGYLALQPKAFFELFMPAPAMRMVNVVNGVGVVCVDGPLCASADGGFEDDYESILARVRTACDDTSVTAVMLKVNSPGGLVENCFDSASAIRDTCALAGKPLYAYVDGTACSAAYALASAASRIDCSSTGILGSIGVISTRCDMSAMDEAQGIRFTFITSGARKADGHADLPLTAEEVQAEQAVVDTLAGVFFGWVAESRKGLADGGKSLEAGVFAGSVAVATGLADSVMTWSQALQQAAAGPVAASTEETAPMNMEEAIAALKAAAEGDDKEASAKAKKMLASMDEKEPEAAAAAEGDDETKDDEKDKKKDEPKDEPKDEDKKEASSVSARLAKMEKQLAASEKARVAAENAERDTLLAKAPEGLRAALKHSPIESLRSAIAALPKSKPAPIITVKGAQGKADSDALALQGKAASRLAAKMGIRSDEKRGSKMVNGRLYFDVPSDFNPLTDESDEKDGE